MKSWFLFCTIYVTFFIFSDGLRPKLLFANRYNICTVETNPNRTNVPALVISGLDDVTAMDFIYDDRMVYWTDLSQEKIRGARLNGSPSSVDVVTTGLMSPDGLACDWVTRKLYWVDSETDRIEVCNVDGTFRKVLVWQDLDQPRAIALDPLKGYMYWTDLGETVKIERMGMDAVDGSRQTLVDTDVVWPSGLTLDYDDGRMYWTDARLHHIHSARFDGTDRRPVIEGRLPHPFAITVFDGAVYWSDWQTQAIYGCDKRTTGARMVVDRLFSPMDVHAFETKRQPRVDTHCSLKNGGCSHLCLLSPYPPYYSCHCPTGIQLLSDNKTCDNGPNKMLLLVRRTDLRLISLDTPDFTDVTLPIRNLRHAIALDYDPVDRMIYWTDDQLHAIRRAKLDGSAVETIVDTEVYNPDGIAVDWAARNLYWTDAGTDRIQVARLNGTSRRIIISDRLEQPRAIVVDPIAGQMYWTDWGQDTKIECSNLDGSDRATLVNTSLGWPNGLAVDRRERRLYWADARVDCIESIRLDGSERMVLVSENLPHVFGFTLLGDYIYWTDWQQRTVERVHKNNAKLRTIIIDRLPDVMGLVAVNVSFEGGTNACSGDNGGCSHLCLYRLSGHVCSCPFGMELLTTDNTTCIVPEAFVLYSTRTEIHVMSLVNMERDTTVPVQGIKSISDVVYSVSDGRIYWTDTGSKTISRAFVNGSSAETIVSTGLESPEGVAVDHLARNLYWTDFGTCRVEMARLDGTSRRVLIWNDVKPRKIVLDPHRGYMYWSNAVNGRQQQLERSTLDGNERRTIATGVGDVNGLAVDGSDGRLFWTNDDNVNVNRGHVESCDVDGRNRRTVVAGLRQPFGLTLYDGQVYWTEGQTTTRSVQRAEKGTGANRTTLVVAGRTTFPLTVTVCHGELQSGWSSCSFQNGGCSHLCISDVKRSNTFWSSTSSHHCTCASHYALSVDNRTCEASDWLMLISQKNSVLQLSLDEFSSVETSVDVPLPIPTQVMRGVRAISFNPSDDRIYWIDGRTKSIRKISTNGSDLVVLLSNRPHQHQSNPFDIALNEQEQLLYWTDTYRNVISAMRLDGSEVGVIVNGSDQRPRHLALAAEVGLIFWTNTDGVVETIECSSLDGSNRRTVFTFESSRLGPLATDGQTRTIFWVDLESRQIAAGDFSGTSRTTLVNVSVVEPVALAVHGNHLYWIDKERKSLERVEKRDGRNRSIVKRKLAHLSDVVVARRRRVGGGGGSASGGDDCAGRHGRCSHLCIRDEDGRARCGCPIGMALDGADERKCKPLQACADDQFTCAAGSNKCVPSSWRCDGEADCRDASDERDCAACPASHFRCRGGGECVAMLTRCDGAADCRDKSDEEDCAECVLSAACAGDRTCYNASQRCDVVVDCWDGTDEVDCARTGGGAGGVHYTVVIIGVVCSVLVVVIVVIAVYMLRSNKDRHCTKIYNENSLIMVAQNSSDSTTSSSYDAKDASLLTHQIVDRHALHRSDGGGDYPSDASTLTSFVAAQYPQQTLDPPPTPVATTTSDDGSVGVCSASLASLSTFIASRPPRRHGQHRRAPPTTPCSTDVCVDDDDDEPSQRRPSSVDGGSETDFLCPPPPTPCSQFFSDDYYSCPSPSSPERSLYSAGDLDFVSNSHKIRVLRRL